MAQCLEKLNTWIWGPWMLVFFMGTGIFLTVRLKFLPWKNLGFALRQVFKDIAGPKKRGEGEITPFQSLMTAMAAMMGTGNIAGVAAAMVLGGPGALIWMLISALLCMSCSLTETTLSMKYRQKNALGQVCGGPMYVMERGIRPKGLGRAMAVLFSLFTLGASLGMGNMTQSNSISQALSDTFHVPPALCGGILFFLCLFVLMGGIACIGKVCSVLVPVMSVAYLAATVAVIIINRQNIPHGLYEMITMAFSPRAIGGGLGGSIVAGLSGAMRWGVARGVFSHEAGLGSAPIAAAAAKTDDPVGQSYIAMTGTFFDTILVCSATGLAIASSGLLGAAGRDGQPLTGVALTNTIFETALGPAGRLIITLGIAMFAFATIIGWEYYGEKALEYIVESGWRRKGDTMSVLRRRRWISFYRLIYCAFVFVGAVASLEAVWNFSDIMNGAMALPNLVCILLLSGEAAAMIVPYECSE